MSAAMIQPTILMSARKLISKSTAPIHMESALDVSTDSSSIFSKTTISRTISAFTNINTNVIMNFKKISKKMSENTIRLPARPVQRWSC